MLMPITIPLFFVCFNFKVKTYCLKLIFLILLENSNVRITKLTPLESSKMLQAILKVDASSIKLIKYK